MVRTRFAPSPTGFLHIGGVRTALFNWLFARKHGGQFILRIDDTDQQRNVQEALQPILDGFRWLGLDWDEGAEVGGPHGPYYQSQKLERYQAAVRELVEKGHAYWDYATPDETKAEMEAAEKEKRPKIYSRRWMAQTDADRRRFEAEGRTGAVKLKMPREGACRFTDLVVGDTEVEWANEQDTVIQRSDGTVMYNLANVVDDFDMKITHVIRAKEHLSNTPRQIFMLEGLGYPRPQYAHVPVVAEPGSKNKLSKRKIAQYLKNPDFKKVYEHGKAIADRLGLTTAAETFNPVIVDFYAQVGYLPDAILNYLVLLGWSLDDKTEDFTRQRMIDLFSLERVNKAPASFDAKKLSAFQERWMQALPVEKKVDLCAPFLQRAGYIASPPNQEQLDLLGIIIRHAGPRLVVAGDVLDYDYFFLPDEEIPYDPTAFQKRLQKPGAAKLLREFHARISQLRSFNTAPLREAIYQAVFPRLQALGGIDEQFIYQQIDVLQRETALADAYSFEADRLAGGEMARFLESQRIQIGDIIHALRIALTGKPIGFGLFETMEVLGRDKCLHRLDLALTKISSPILQELESRLEDIPQALGHARHAPDSNEPYTLYQGQLHLSMPQREVEGNGSVRLAWLPNPSIRFELRLPTVQPVNPGPGKIIVPDKGATAKVLVTSVQYSDDLPRIAGIPNSRFATRQTDDIEEVRFFLPNYFDYIGSAIRDGLNSWAGRSVLNSDGWSIVIDGVAKQRERLDRAKTQGVTAITHAGLVHRHDKSSFSIEQLDDLIYALQTYLSFTRGFNVAPIILSGIGRNGNVVWQDWSLRVFDTWRSVESWFPVHDKDCLSAGFVGFHEKWRQSDWRDMLRTVVYWYVLANSPGAIDRGILSAHAALDGIASGVRYSGGVPELLGSDNGSSYAGRLETLLKAVGIPAAIPEYMEDLRLYASHFGLESGPAVTRHLRNVIAHPGPSSRSVFQETSHFEGKIWQAWVLSLSYIELLLLWIIGYNGRYASRLGRHRWTGQTEPVPWSETRPSITSA